MDNNFTINKCIMMGRYTSYVSVNVDVEINDIINEMSKYEKEDLYEKLKDELGIDDVIDCTPTEGTTTETELFNICKKVYENRNFLTNKDIQLLIKLSKKGWYDEVV